MAQITEREAAACTIPTDRPESADVMPADAARRPAVSGRLHAVGPCRAFSIPPSSHTAPTPHRLERLHDHVRLERMPSDGAPQPANGAPRAAPPRPGFGIEFKHEDAEPYAL